MARTPMALDEDTIVKLAAIHCTMEEIASIAGCSKDTIERRPELMEKIDKARATGKSSLRRHQWTLAQKGNATMLIWLGKQLLGQKDISRIELTDVPEDALKAEARRRGFNLIHGEVGAPVLQLPDIKERIEQVKGKK